MSMKNMPGKQKRKARPRISLEEEGKKRASEVTESNDLKNNASTREDHTGSRANWWLSEINRQSRT